MSIQMFLIESINNPLIDTHLNKIYVQNWSIKNYQIVTKESMQPHIFLCIAPSLIVLVKRSMMGNATKSSINPQCLISYGMP